jgi:hypothetical protein
MRFAVATVNIVLGLAYCGYGVMTAIEMKRDWATYGFSHFGVAWIFMAFTCGPHHLDHGIHAVLGAPRAGFLDVLSVVVGLPVGVIWLALRVEAFMGGRGDRFVEGTPGWLLAVPTVAAVYVTALVAAALDIPGGLRFDFLILANVLLVGLYMAIGWVLLRTQLQNREPMGGWSLSGLTLTAVFPTCALMHAVLAVYTLRGFYDTEAHGLIIDWLSVPASIYFLWVVRGLYRESLQDWNSVAGDLDGPLVPAPARGELIQRAS